MLFNSYEFIFLFLVGVVGLFWGYAYTANRQKVSIYFWFLIVASVLFYGQWNLEHLFVLLGSISINYIYAKYFSRTLLSLVGIVVLNLVPLVYYKYSGVFGGDSLVLPLAISFFTFQQIAFVVDLYRGKIQLDGLKEYLFFVLFFPQLVAGPIVHYNELIGQVKKPNWLVFDGEIFSRGVLLFSLGLFKKVVLADSFAVVANDSFGGVSTLDSYDAWIGLFAYSFQIYFDFSGYADMAIGLGLLFGIVLPQNFNSPYKSRNIVEFWRNWHITLSNFLKEHIYIPLGGNRVGMRRGVFNLLVTMSIAGVWHGAGLSFLVWGFLHGVLLGGVHLYGNVVDARKNTHRAKSAFFIIFTFMSVTLLWVLFRCENLEEAMVYYGVLFSFDGILPQKLPEFILLPFSIAKEYLVLIGFVVVWFLPNAWEFSKKVGYLQMFVGALMFFVSLRVMANTPSMSFVYFNF